MIQKLKWDIFGDFPTLLFFMEFFNLIFFLDLDLMESVTDVSEQLHARQTCWASKSKDWNHVTSLQNRHWRHVQILTQKNSF